MSWVTIVVIIAVVVLFVFTFLAVLSCCKMASLADEAALEHANRRMSREDIARKLEDIAYSDEKDLSGLAINTLLKTSEYYKSDEAFHNAIPLMCNIRVCARRVAKNMSEEVCSRYAIMKGCTQNELDEAPGDVKDVVANIIMREIREAIEGEFPEDVLKQENDL